MNGLRTPGTTSDARQRFHELAARRDADIDVAEAALVIAQEEYPQLCVASYLARLDALATAARAEIRPSVPVPEQIARLNHHLFVRGGFAGNRNDYYDPRNSYLNEVLDRRTGIPITLSVVYCEVARRLELPVYGVSFPGHFLACHIGEPEIIIDPFFGSVISIEECTQRLTRIYGEEARFDRRLLQPATPREILVRMLSNLKQTYIERNDQLRALACVDRILLLVPDTARELRDRGILYHGLECFAAALQDLTRYLQLAPDDEAVEAIRAAMPELQRRAAQLQ